MEIGYEMSTEPTESATPERGGSSLRELLEDVQSEWIAFGEALTAPGRGPVRKWLGWALYRVAARVNPEIEDRDH